MKFVAVHRVPLFAVTVLAVLAATACAGAPGPSTSPGASPAPTASPSPTPAPSATPTAALSPAQLRYILLDQFSPISWCDPDFYPIQRQDEQQSADERWAEIIADAPTYPAIIDHLALDPGRDPAGLDAAERLAVYREWKLLNAVALQPFDGVYGFDLISETNVGLGQGIHSAGTIDGQGAIELALQEQSFLTACPICLARGTLIDTPTGKVAVENLSVGDLVWTTDGSGARVAQALVRVGSTPVPASHKVVHLVLDDGREAWVSPGHPTADGRVVGGLLAGDALDGATVVRAERVAYVGGATFDVLPGGPTGLYWANGILLGSTIR